MLAYRGGNWGGEAIRLAVVELVARRILRLESVEATGRWRSAQRWALTDGPAAGRTVEPPLDVILDLVRSTRRERLEGVLVKDLRRAIRSRSGGPRRTRSVTSRRRWWTADSWS